MSYTFKIGDFAIGDTVQTNGRTKGITYDRKTFIVGHDIIIDMNNFVIKYHVLGFSLTFDTTELSITRKILTEKTLGYL